MWDISIGEINSSSTGNTFAVRRNHCDARYIIHILHMSLMRTRTQSCTRSEYRTQLASVIFDEIFDLTGAGVYSYYIIYVYF